MMAALDHRDPRRAIELMLESIIARTSDPRSPRGCLITNTALECPGLGDDIARKIAEGVGRQESAIYSVLRRAQAEGSLDSAQDARALARLFLGVAQGMNVINKATADPSMLKDMVSAVMSVWKTPVRRRRTMVSA
jgi:TetR/AcrR family transcriptional repressor of nem operon